MFTYFIQYMPYTFLDDDYYEQKHLTYGELSYPLRKKNCLSFFTLQPKKVDVENPEEKKLGQPFIETIQK